MDTYSWLRELADSWVLLAMTLFYLGAILWAFRPGSRDVHRHIAETPFRNEEAPPCAGNCDTCACSGVANIMPENN